MLAQRFHVSLAAAFSRWKPAFIAVLVVLVSATAVRISVKALKPGRTGELSRTAFLRWRPQIQALDAGTDIYRTFNYPNPPIMALILKPLTWLPPLAGLLAWFALKVLMAVLMAGMIFRLIEAGGPPIPDWAKALAIALALHPILGDLSHGNVNLFIGFLVIAGLDSYRRGLDLRAGLLIALAIACKVTPALFVPYLVWKKAWRTLAGVALGLALWCVIVPGAVLGFDANRTLLTSWFEVMVRPFVLEGQVTSEHPNQSLPGVLTRLLTDRPSFVDYAESDGRMIATDTHTLANLGATTVAILVKGAMLAFAVAIIVLARTRERCGLAFAAECSLIVLGMLLFSERTWKHHATALLLPYAVLLAATIATKSKPVWVILLLAPLLTLIPSLADDEMQDLCMVYGIYTLLYSLLLLGNLLVLGRSASASAVSQT